MLKEIVAFIWLVVLFTYVSMCVYMYMYVDVGYAIVTSCDSIVSDDSVTQLNALLADTGVPLLDVNSG